MKIPATYLATLLTPLLLSAKDIYVAQTSAGNGSGTGPSDALSLSWLNSGSNWGTSATQVNAGDIVHLVGTFTNQLTIQGSGTPGMPITLLFEPDAKFSAAAWGNAAPRPDNYSNDPIVCNGFYVSYLIISGGINGLIECTDNGQAKGNTNNCTGIYLLCGSGVEIKNLTISNLWYRIAGSQSDPASASGIVMRGAMMNCRIHNCTAVRMDNCLSMYPDGGISTNLQIYSNNVSDCSWGIALGAFANSTNYDSQIWHNHIDNFTNYIGNPNNHQDGIICYITTTNESSYGLKIFGNTIGPNVGVSNTTSAIFVNDTQGTPGAWHFHNPQIYNNLLTAVSPWAWSDGFISIASGDFHIWNNTIASYATGIGIKIDGGQGDFINNLTYQVGTAFYLPNGTVTNSDFNDWNIVNDVNHGFGIPNSGGTQGWTSWTNNSRLDLHSSINQPSLAINFAPRSTDSLVRGRGTNLEPIGIISDINGNPRPISGAWDIGALQHVTNLPAPPSGLHLSPPP